MTVAPAQDRDGSTTLAPPPAATTAIKEPLQTQPSAPHKRLVSSAVCALVLFAAVNAYLSICSPLHFDPYRYVFRGWPWWLLNDLRHDRHPRNAALLGSSLMASAVAGSDAKFLNRNLDQTDYHNAAYLDHVLSTNIGGKFSTIDLAIPGQMPSDAYMTLRAAMNLGQHPNLVVYGVAPRDFIDSTLPSPLDTETYHYLSRVVNIEDIAPGLFKNPLVKLNRSLEQSIYLYGHCLDFQIAEMDLIKGLMTATVPTPSSPHPFTYWDRIKLVPDYLKGELYPTAMIASPLEQKFSISGFTDNTKEYIDRYKHPRQEIFDQELFFLSQLAQLCHKNKMEFVLVNMPITKRNIAILGEQRYQQYLESLRQFGNHDNVPVLDLNDFSRYKIEDFHDLVHLNGYGGQKFFDSLGASLANLLGDTLRRSVAE